MKKYLFLLAFGLLALGAKAQEIPAQDSIPACGATGSFLEKGIDRELMRQLNAQWQSFSANNPQKANGRLSADDPVLYVPVMFHIAHLGEAIGTGSNLSEGQIQASLATLNNIYRARGQYAAANDTRIEFVLANCSGIDRANASGIPNYSAQGAIYTDRNQQQQIQQLFGVEQNKYLNIYVCHRLTGAGGWAYYGGRMFLPISDFPAVGVNSVRSEVFAHEMGHSLFLAHTFEGQKEYYLCPPNDNPLIDGDKVADTPPHRIYDLLDIKSDTAKNFCTGQPFGIDLFENHMAYYVTSKRFTGGQIERMRFYLQNYLTNWTNSDAIPIPNNRVTITSVPAIICAGTIQNVNFTNSSGINTSALLVKKGDDVVYYVDNFYNSSSSSFYFPNMKFGIPTQNNPIYNNPMLEGNDYHVEVVAGCNRVQSALISVSNLSAYTFSYLSSDDEEITYPYLSLCQPSSLTLKAGVKLTGGGKALLVSNSKLNDFEFQWKKDGSNLDGEVAPSFTTSASGGYQYTVKGKGCVAQKVSDNATIRSGTYIINSTQIKQNTATIQCSGNSIKLSSDYISNSASYLWYHDGVLIPNQTKRALEASVSGTYKVVPSDGDCYYYSTNEGINLSFGSAIYNPITTYHQDTIVCMSGDLTSTLSGDNFQYQWLRNGLPIEYANYPSYVPRGNAGTNAIFSLRTTQNACSSVSNGIRMYFQNKVDKPRLIGPSTYFAGVKHVITLENTNGWRREWYKDGQLIESNSADHISITSPGTYKVRQFGPFQSSSFDCSLESDPIVIAPTAVFNFRIIASDTIRLACTDYQRDTSPYLKLDDTFFKFFYEFPQFPSNFTFRWMKDGEDLPIRIYGPTDRPYFYASEDGEYRLRVDYGSGSTISNPIKITSSNSPILGLSTSNASLNACKDDALSISLPNKKLAQLSTRLPFVWYKDGIIIPGQSRSTIIATQSGTYTATYQGIGCTVSSEPLTVTIGGTPSATISGIYGIRNGETANLKISSSTPGPYFFTLSDGTEQIGQGSTTLVPKSPSTSTIYTLDSFGTHCGISPNASGFARIDITNCAIGIVNATLGGGAWNTPALWSCGSVPTVIDAVRINSPHTITLPADYTATAKSVELQGNIQYNANARVQLGQQ